MPGAGADEGPTWRASVTLVGDAFRVGIVGTGLPDAPVALAPLRAEPAGLTGASSTADGFVTRGPRAAIAYEVPAPRGELRVALLADILLRPVDPAWRGSETVEAHAPDEWETLVAQGEGGAVVLARELHVEAVVAPYTQARVASVGPPRGEDIALLEKGLAYLGAQQEHLAQVTVLRAPRALLPADVATAEFVAVADDEPVETLARLLARGHQRFRVVEVAPTSGAWLKEGVERYHAALALVAAEVRTAERVDAAIAEARATDAQGALPQGAAGSTLARQKGLVVVAALDAELRRASSGAVALPDLLDELSRSPDRHDSVSIQRAAERIANASLAPFFDAYVYGEAWPEVSPVEPGSDLAVVSLAIEPARAVPGEPAIARFVVEERGTRARPQDVALAVDGAQVRALPFALRVGERAERASEVVAHEPGPHLVSVGARRATLTVLTPPDIGLARVSVAPAEPRAGEAFQLLAYVENAGQRAGSARVEVREEGILRGRTTEALVDGETTRTMTVPLVLDAPGLHVLDVRLVTEEGERALTYEVALRYDDVEEETPAAWWLAVVALAAVAAIARRGAAGGRRR